MRFNRRYSSKLLCGAALFTLMAAAPVIAQETATDEEDSARTLGQITVTATRREASIQDIPIAVSAYNQDSLDKAGVSDLSTLDQVSPSFSLNTSDTQSGGITLRLRGVGTTGNNIGLESSVAVFLDGVYLSRPGVALGDLLDLEQVEVLRGPQGTLFGRNTSAGALNITTKKPNLVDYEGFGNFSYGNFDLINVQAGINVPVIEDTLGFRVSGAYRTRDGILTNQFGDDQNTRDRWTVRAQGLLDLKQAGTLRLIGDYSEVNDECCDAVFFNDATTRAIFAPAGLEPTGGAPNIGPDALDNYDSNSANFNDPTEQFGISGEYNVETPIGDFVYIGSYRDFESNSTRNTDFVGLNIFTVGATPEAAQFGDGNAAPENLTSIKTQTHEARLQGTFADRLDWLVGAYYSDEEIDSSGSLTLLNEFQSGVSAGIFGSPANLLLAFSNGVDATGDFANNSFLQDGESWSIFTHNVLNVTDELSFTVGLRYVDETKDGSFTQLGGEFDACNATFANIGNVPAALGGAAVALNCFVFAAPAFDPANPGPLFGAIAATPAAPLLGLLPQEFDDTFKDDELVYTIKAAYELTPNVNIFGGFTHGFKSGGFNLDASAGAGGADPRFNSEEIDAIEFGLKSTLLDGRATANVSFFHQEIDDFQVLEFTGVRFQTFNVDSALATGVEFEGAAQVTENLGVSLGLTYTNARYPNDCATQDPADAAFNANAANLCGASLTNAPEFVGIFSASYEYPVQLGSVDGNLFANGSVRYETDRRTSTQPTEIGNPALLLPGDIQEDNAKLNLRVGFETENWGIELWGQNITDQRTKNVTINIPLRGGEGNRARGQFVQEPRTYGITLRTKF